MRVLEVGCGAGSFCRLLRERNSAVELWGIEPVAAAASAAESVVDRIFCEGVESCIESLPDKHFDSVVFNDVLEHLVEPWSVLRSLRGKLRDSGAVTASLPNIRHWSRIKQLWLDGDWTYQDDGLLDRTHLRFFTPQSMRSLFEEADYKVTRLEGLKREPLPWKFSLASRMLAVRMDEMRCIQYAVVASPRT